MARVLVACPTHDGRIDGSTARSMFCTVSKEHQCEALDPLQGSLLALNCNTIWCDALNRHEAGRCDWLALLHADVTPDPWWVDTLIREAEEYDAAVMSAVVALKDTRGLTSTAVEDFSNPWQPKCRITVRQALRWSTDPEAWPCGYNVNTGCCVIRLDRKWPEAGVFFDTRDRIVRGVDGKWRPEVQPEDWRFSRRMRAAGGLVLATTAVRTRHRGYTDYTTRLPWGADVDEELAAKGA